ncbi:spore cortex biosynthesis protein YabQ [Oceanobacillus polygoni]|uniref:Spore cortex biosynthesis protein YabQ n=1 Tax=Oceanobacillus polygoni TaxID=1235259 RepID=A0A9X1CCZ9_9BACI|nr:spore cortex biosynthesis protein YabQ [Oceanobacillus polygoni]MBP2078521.1 spore cortex biosynthesis protein YabQ [Oceanobacillus polygoni]
MSLSIQFLTMITMVLSGFYLGIVQETFRRLTYYWKRRVFLTYFLEISFWLTQTAIILYVLFRVNAGEIRVYVILACLLGFSIYQVLAKAAYKRLLEWIIRIVSAVYRFFRNLVHTLIISPISWIIRTLFRLVLWILMLIGTILLFILKVVITPFRWVGMGIYHLIPDGFKKNLHKLAGFYSTMKNICYKGYKKLEKLLFKRG